MSALNFQNVMAHLIRYPDDTLDLIESKLDLPPLSVEERGRLQKMAGDPLVRKFGRKMSYCRRRDATQILPLTKDFIPEEVLNRLFYEGFERTKTDTDFVMLGVQFAEFMLTDPFCQDALDQCPPFVRDVLRYECTKAFVVRQVIHSPDPALPKGSLLRHSAFKIIHLDYAVPAIDKLKQQQDQSPASAPEKKATILIFMRSETLPFYRMFQIDGSIEGFLTVQKTDPAAWTVPLPPAYDGMVGVGLCRPREADPAAAIGSDET